MKKFNNVVLLQVFAAVALMIIALFGGFVISVGILFVAILAIFLVELRKDAFDAVTPKNEIVKDRRFEIRKGQSVFLKNYDLSVKFLKLEAPKTAVHAHTPKILKLLVSKDHNGKVLSFDINNMRAIRIQHAFGRDFHFIDFRNGRAVIAVR